MKKHHVLVIAAALAGACAPLAHATPVTFLQYSTPAGTGTISFDGTTLTGSAISVTLDYLVPVPGAPATGTLTFSATAVSGTAGTFAGFYGVSLDDITFSVTNGATNILSGTSATGSLSGADGALEFSADGAATGTSDIYSGLNALGFQIGIVNQNPDLSVSNETLSSFTAAPGTGAFTAADLPTVKSVSAVPEPTSIALLGTGLLTLAGAARRKLAA